MSTTAKLFVTDYNSYNNGTQFQFGHWVELNQFSDADEFNDYLTAHFESVGISDPEPMFTDFEGFPADLYGESLSNSDLEKIFKYIELDYENLDDNDKLNLWNEYCSENSYFDDEIYYFDDEFFSMFFEGKPMEAARAASFGSLNWSDEYIRFDGYGNLESTNNVIDWIDESPMLEWLMTR